MNRNCAGYIIHFLGMLGVLSWFAAGSALAQNASPTSSPDVRVEYFGPERGYVVGAESVTLLCIVRNVGTGPLPEKTLRLRCYAISGLDYTTGDTLPVLPAMARNQALAFRWRLAQSGDTGPFIAAVILENTGATGSVEKPQPGGGVILVNETNTPRTALTVVPRLPSAPRMGDRVVPPSGPPQATATRDDAWISNDQFALRAVRADRAAPLLILSGREGASWRTLANGIPLARVFSGEDGQRLWWEPFRWEQARAQSDKVSALLTLNGTIGARWKATLTLTAIRDSAAINGRLRLTAGKTLRLAGIELPSLLVSPATATSAKADGSPISLTTEEPILPEDTRIVAARAGGITFGLTWPTATPFPGWHWSSLPGGNPELLSVLGAQCLGDPRGELVTSGSSIEITFRLFAVSPSDTLRDALRFLLP